VGNFGRRGWKKCGCLIHVSGTLGGTFNRRQTGKSDWDEAKALVALWERTNSDFLCRWRLPVFSEHAATCFERSARRLAFERGREITFKNLANITFGGNAMRVGLDLQGRF
jgi:hypothetical protein